MSQLPPLALYIHIPWCEKKCPYCDFNSAVVKDKQEDIYLQALIADLQKDAQFIQGRTISSIFFGGGTPSLISASTLDKLFNALHTKLVFAKNCEITLEANPGTVDKQKLADFKKIGINRLSFGVQSFQDNFLQTLGRIHTGNVAKQAFYYAREVGFDNINLDLMFGLPQQNLEFALQDLTQAVQLAPEHLSWYQLTIEPNTAFYKRPPKLPKDDDIFEIYTEGRKFLAQNKYRQYEVSAYAQADKECRHNINYWQFGDYLGIGSGAASKLTCLENSVDNSTDKLVKNLLKIIRKTKKPIFKNYLAGLDNGNFSHLEEEVVPENLIFEFMLNALRLKDGVELDYFTQRTGLPLSLLQDKLQKLHTQGLLEFSANNLRTSDAGFLWLNEILLEFLD